MKIFKYTFVFFLLTLSLRLYSSTIINNIYVNNFFTDNVSLEEKYNPDDENFWKKETFKTDDTYSFWFWLSNVSVLSTGLCCILSYFLFTEWFLLLATILGLLYVIHFFVQITSPTALCLLNFETKEKFERYASKSNPEIKSVVTYEREYKETNSKGEEKIKTEKIGEDTKKCLYLSFIDPTVSILQGGGNGKNLLRYKIDQFITFLDGARESLSNKLRNLLLTQKDELIKAHQLEVKSQEKRTMKRYVSWQVPKIENYMLIAVDKSLKPWHVSFCWFLLFTILPFSQLYKLWVNRYCCDVTAKIEYKMTSQ